MADFCVQCADDLGFEDTDLAGITTMEDWAQEKAAVVICEGCGVIQVDPHGNCVSADCAEKGHKGARRKMDMCQCGHDDGYHYLYGNGEWGPCKQDGCICEKFHKASPPPDGDDPPAFKVWDTDFAPPAPDSSPDSAPDTIDPGGGDSGGGGSSDTF